MGRGRKWRQNYRLINQEVLVLEEEEKQLELVYPQVIVCTPHQFCMLRTPRHFCQASGPK